MAWIAKPLLYDYSYPMRQLNRHFTQTNTNTHAHARTHTRTQTRARTHAHAHTRTRARTHILTQNLKQHKPPITLSNWSNICSKFSMTYDYFSAFGSNREVWERQIEPANMQFNGYFETIIGSRWENRASEVTTPVNHPGSILNYRSHYKRMSASHLKMYRTFPDPLKQRIIFREI